LTPPDVWAAFSAFPLQMPTLGPIRLLITSVALGFGAGAFILRQTPTVVRTVPWYDAVNVTGNVPCIGFLAAALKILLGIRLDGAQKRFAKTYFRPFASNASDKSG